MELREDWHKTLEIGNDHGRGDPFAAAVRWSRMPMVFADPRQLDCPIIYANDSFCRMTGYTIDEVVGRNCRFLQGPDTDPASILAIREAIDKQEPIGIDILNYRKDGTSYWNALYISPVFNEAGDLLYYFSSQFDATERRAQAAIIETRRVELEREVGHRTESLQAALTRLNAAIEEKTLLIHEIDHRVKNNLQTISTLVAMQARTLSDPTAVAALKSVQERIDALGTVHRRLTNNGSVGSFELSALVGDLAPDIIKGSARANIELHLNLEPVDLSSQIATPVSLILNELITNAIRHAWPDGRNGQLRIATRRSAPHAVLTIEDDGVGLPGEPATRPMSGLKLAEALVRQVRGTISRGPVSQGTRLEVKLPIDRNTSC